MNKQKLSTFILIIFLLAPLAIGIQPVKADTQIFGLVCPAGESAVTITADNWYGLPITMDVDRWVWSGHGRFQSGSGEDYNLKFIITNSTFNIIATSDNVFSDTDAAWEYLEFTFSSSVQLQGGETYYIGVVGNSSISNDRYGTATRFTDSSNSWSTPVDPTDCTNASTTAPALWIIASSDFDSPEATASPVPFPTGGAYSGTDVNTMINTFVGYMIPLMLFLLPALILGWLTHFQKWPILIGLAIGSGLTYLFLGTQYVWLVLLVVIGIGASAYQSSRGG